MDVAAIATEPATRGTTSGIGELGGDDFLQLLVTQLTHQDPLSPTSNEDLLRQLSAVRDIQLSTSLVESLETLTGNQRYGAAAALIGKSVTGRMGSEETGFETVSGVVVGVRFDGQGRVSLELDGGRLLPMEQLETVRSPEAAGDSLIGRTVRGVDRTRSDSEVIEGVVTAVRRDESGRTILELDTGESLALTDLISSA